VDIIEIREIMDLLPHRYPFLLLDRVLDYTPGKTLTAVKNISVNEPMFTGHFPRAPIYPGVLIMESLAQATGILAFKTSNDSLSDDGLYYFAGIDNARFKKPVVPGDQMILQVEIVAHKRNIWKFKGTALVDDIVVAKADLMCAESTI